MSRRQALCAPSGGLATPGGTPVSGRCGERRGRDSAIPLPTVVPFSLGVEVSKDEAPNVARHVEAGGLDATIDSVGIEGL